MTAEAANVRKENTAPDAAGPKIEIRGASKRYTEASVTLAPVDLSIRENEFVALVGRSGCGKTTLLNMVAGLVEPSSGQILVDGSPVTGPGHGKGVVFQQHALFPWLTARNNIVFGARSRGLEPSECQREATQLLDLIGLTAYGDRYPNQLSGGMQQRVAIARALALDPQILLMDEPFGALDEITRIEMQDELLRVWSSRRKTVIFVTHSLSEALHLADRIVVMGFNPGHVAAEYTIDKPRPRSRIDRSLLDLQEKIWEHLK
jgi:ABC-type nitrate/sulfonate/bicarbonate transport system ATPase subunit